VVDFNLAFFSVHLRM